MIELATAGMMAIGDDTLEDSDDESLLSLEKRLSSSST